MPALMFTCPMHPEVIQPAAGACPKCGMALEQMLSLSSASDAPEKNAELIGLRRRLLVCTVFSLPLMIAAMAELAPMWLEALLALPVVTWGAWPIWQRAASSITRRNPNMFTLIGLGTATAIAASLPSLARPTLIAPSYLEASSVIVTLVLLGQVLELGAREKTRDALRSLLALSPKTVLVLTSCGHERDRPIDALKVGDRFRVRPGERVATDGVVEEGASAIDESMLTGEAKSILKTSGAHVTGGTMNGSGTLVVKASRVGGETRLAQIVALVDAAQRTRAPAQKLADSVSGIFVYAVVAIAIAAFFGWYFVGPEPRLHHAISNAVAVVIIACPCALGLATPMALAVGMGRGATAGILVRDAEALEMFARTTVIAIDKTGTLTEGAPRVVEVVLADGVTREHLLHAAASIEGSSEHPLAASIRGLAEQENIARSPVTNFEARAGLGVVGTVDEDRISVGSAKFMRAIGVAIAETEDARTLVYVARGDTLLGSFAIADPLRSGAKEAVSSLIADGARVVLLSGDSKFAAETVGHALGVDEVIGEASPEEKARVIDRLRKGGAIVAMAGDGINDAIALAKADVGIAIGTGADVAIESAGVTLAGGDIGKLVAARTLARATLRNVKQNLFFAFAYNAAGIPVAAGVLQPLFGIEMSPMLAAAAMCLSSVSVIANALRLRTLKL